MGGWSMEPKTEKFIKITLDNLNFQKVHRYCIKYGIDENEFVNTVMKCFFKENQKKHDTMIKGYKEMSEINLDICNEFEDSEKDSNSHV